jgi:hypothetical protein
MKIRKTLYAGEGKILTNGTDYAKVRHLYEGEDESSFYEITEEQYQEKLNELSEEFDR